MTCAQTPQSGGYRETVLMIQTEIQAGRLADAQSHLAAAQTRFPADGGLDNLQGIIAIQEGKAELARSSFQHAIDHSPRLVSAYLNLARLDLESDSLREPARSKDALQLYDRVLAIEPGNTEARIDSAGLLLAAGQPKLTIQRLDLVGAGTTQNTRVQALLCASAAALAHREQANAMAEALKRNPEVTEADVQAALPGFRMGHRADLLVLLLTSISAHAPLSAEGLRLLGLAQEANGQLAEARSTLEEAFAANPTSLSVLTDLSRIASAQGQDQEALGYLAHARELAPKDAALAFRFGVICFRMNLLGESQKALEEALALQPEEPLYLLSVAKVTMLSQDPLKAAPYLDHFRKLSPSDAEGNLLTGAMYFRAKDFDRAEVWLLRAKVNPNTTAEANLYLGSIARQRSQPEQALVLLTEAVKEQPGDAQTHAELGLTYFELKRYPEAEKELDNAVGIDPMSYLGNFGLVQLYAHNNDPRRGEQARRFQEVAAKRDQDVQQAMRVIEVHPDDSSLGGR